MGKIGRKLKNQPLKKSRQKKEELVVKVNQYESTAKYTYKNQIKKITFAATQDRVSKGSSLWENKALRILRIIQLF